MTTDEKILYIIKLFYTLTNRTLSNHTDIKDTYDWRYSTKFLNTMEQCNAPWLTILKIIYYVIQYSQENKLLRNGLWVLTKKNIIDISIKIAQKENKQLTTNINILQNSYQYVQKNNFKLDEIYGAFPNIVIWYTNKRICSTYIALSESCRKTLIALDENDLKMLPLTKTISDKRLLCFIDQKYKTMVKNILQNDFIQIGTSC